MCSLYELLTRMKWLIETMLSLSRIEADAVRFARDKVSCRSLIEQSVETVAVTAELKNIEIISGNMTAVSNGGEMYASGTLDGNGGEVTFYNEKTDWPGFSDTSSVVNRIGG